MLPVLSLSPIVEVSVIGVPSPTPARGLWSGQAQGCVKDEPGPGSTRIPVPPRVQPCLPSPPGQALPTWHPRSGMPSPSASSAHVTVCPAWPRGPLGPWAAAVLSVRTHLLVTVGWASPLILQMGKLRHQAN